MLKKKVNCQFRSYRFEAPLLWLGLVLFFIGLTAYLCLWQLQRGHEKAKQAVTLNTTALHSLNGNNALSQPPVDFTPIQATGFFDTKHLFLLENRFYQERLGYELLIPFKLKDSQTYVLVNAGFVPRMQERSILPPLPTIPTGEIELTGITHYPIPNRLVRDWLESHRIDWPLVIQDIDLLQMANILDISFTPYLMDDLSPNPLSLPKEKRQAYLSPTRHYGYALQWGLLSLTLLLCLTLASIRKVEQ